LPAEPLLNAPYILKELQSGGVAIYLYHPESHKNVEEKSAPQWWKNCATTNALTKAGVQTAVGIGNAIKRMRIPVSEIRTSEFCRALDTGTFIQIGFPKTQSDLNSAEVQTETGLSSAQIAENIRRQLLSVPLSATSTIFVGHRLPPETSPDPILAGIAPGDAILFKRTASDGLLLLARLRPGQWETLAQEDENERARVARENRLRAEWLERERERQAREAAAILNRTPAPKPN
jgi:broad specificity phosphatase PhoE